MTHGQCHLTLIGHPHHGRAGHGRENTGCCHRQGTHDSPTEVLGNMVLVFQNGGNRRVSGPSLQSQDLRSCGPVPFRVPPQTWMADCRIGAAHRSHLAPASERPRSVTPTPQHHPPCRHAVARTIAAAAATGWTKAHGERMRRVWRMPPGLAARIRALAG